jgi:hypothetical protein
VAASGSTLRGDGVVNEIELVNEEIGRASCRERVFFDV